MDSSTHQYNSVDIDEDGKSIISELNLISNDTGEKLTDIKLFVSDEAAFYFKTIVYISMTGCVSIIGIVTNTINIIVFVRQGIFQDGGSPSLLGLAVADLFCVISMLWTCISFAIVFIDPPGLSWTPWDIMYIAGVWPHLMFAQITRMVTAYVAFERCICVVLPFRVKSIFTPRRTITIIAGIFVCCGATYSPVFITQQLKWVRDSNTNTTRLALVSSPIWELVVGTTYFVNTLGLNLVSVALVFVCTMITASRIKLSKAWRDSLATGSSSNSKPEVPQLPKTTSPSTPEVPTTKNDENISKQEEGKAPVTKISKSKMQKEKKLVRMILLISITSLVCFSPDLTSLILNSINYEIRFTGTYANLSNVMYSFTFLMETINSSINIIIYYKMSSRYKQEFLLLFGLTK